MKDKRDSAEGNGVSRVWRARAQDVVGGTHREDVTPC